MKTLVFSSTIASVEKDDKPFTLARVRVLSAMYDNTAITIKGTPVIIRIDITPRGTKPREDYSGYLSPFCTNRHITCEYQ